MPAGEEELRFVVGNACSRLINLLMDARAERALVAEEAAFLSEQAALLAALLDPTEPTSRESGA